MESQIRQRLCLALLSLAIVACGSTDGNVARITPEGFDAGREDADNGTQISDGGHEASLPESVDSGRVEAGVSDEGLRPETRPFIDEALGCAPSAEPFTKSGDTHHKVTLTDPRATCNDGTPGVMYIKPSTRVEAARLWVVHLQGGGSCRTPAECTARWCDVSGRMSSRGTPASIQSEGIFSVLPRNTAAHANQVFVYYCSSDNFAGRMNEFVVDGPEHTPYRIDFNGDAILNAALDALEAGARSDDGDTVLPPLTDASMLILSGSSAGCTAVTYQGERVAQRLATHGVSTRLICDGSLSPMPEHLENPETVSGLSAQRAETFAVRMDMQDLNLDESCIAAAAPDEVYLCESAGWVLPNYVDTVPLFIYTDQGDPVLWSGYRMAGLSIAEFAAGVRAGLSDAATADTPTPISVFGPRCNVHTALHHNDRFLNWTVTTPDGRLTFHDALVRWLQGEHVVAIESAETDSGCD